MFLLNYVMFLSILLPLSEMHTNTHTCTHCSLFLCHIFASIEASTSHFLPFSSLSFCFLCKEESIYVHLSKPHTLEREKLQCLQYSECVSVCQGTGRNALGYYEETLMRQEIPVIGNKTPSYLFK